MNLMYRDIAQAWETVKAKASAGGIKKSSIIFSKLSNCMKWQSIIFEKKLKVL